MQAKDRSTSPSSAPWNKGKIVGQKRPFKLQEVWAIRIRLQWASRTRDLALFDLAIDSNLLGCDLVAACPAPAFWADTEDPSCKNTTRFI
jgi:hypothetical protein